MQMSAGLTGSVNGRNVFIAPDGENLPGMESNNSWKTTMSVKYNPTTTPVLAIEIGFSAKHIESPMHGFPSGVYGSWLRHP